MFRIADALNNVTQSVKKAEIENGRVNGSVKLLAVSKRKPASSVLEAFELGQRAFGENYVSEAIEKQIELKDLLKERCSELEWHYIGPIQSNKTRQIAESFSWVQSLDRSKIAQRLHDQRPSDLEPMSVCIQVNIDNEETKAGVLPEQVLELAHVIADLDRLNLRGLMCIPKAQQSKTDLARSFGKMHELYETLQGAHKQVDTLSMGMSSDLSQAIAEGSTMVRVGTALFGERNS